MRDLQNKGAIEAFKYDGDQDIDNIADATINNNPADIQNGEYKFNLFVVVAATLEVIDVNIVVSAQGTLVTTQN